MKSGGSLMCCSRKRAYGKFPTPTANLVAAAGLRVEHALFTDERIVRQMDATPAERVKRARDELLGVVDIQGRTIYVRPEVPLGNHLPPLALHETAHAYLRWQRDIYLFVQEDGAGLHRDVKDQFEREANQFAWELVFQLDKFQQDAESGEFSLRTPANLAHRYGTTPYAAIRRFVETNRRSCALLIWSLLPRADGTSWSPPRSVQSPSFSRTFGDASWRNALNPFVCSELLAGSDYGARYPIHLSGSDLRPLVCEAQSLRNYRHLFVLVYPEHELLAVPMV